ncbi:hypothetical protein ACIRPU_19910 [Streptomyces sp. NPDC102259]|uniref:hypothetical protein n=1 Tax=Streptomyces sp. NPDC102259 TaxID=3366148 RepID=UPI00382F9FED
MFALVLHVVVIAWPERRDRFVEFCRDLPPHPAEAALEPGSANSSTGHGLSALRCSRAGGRWTPLACSDTDADQSVWTAGRSAGTDENVTRDDAVE